MADLQFPPLADSIFIDDNSKLITMPSWVIWLTHVGNLLSALSGDGGGAGTLTLSKIGRFTRDLSANSATVVYTGIGFRPAHVIFLSSTVNNSISVGLDDGTTAYCIHINGCADMYINSENALSIMAIDYNHIYSQSAKISAKSSDGFSLDWYKIGSPSASAIFVYYIAYK